MRDLGNIMRVFEGSDGAETSKMYAELSGLGPRGLIAVDLFRAQKNSSKAKVYRGRGTRGAYDVKQWAMGNLVDALTLHGVALDIPWGWGEDKGQEHHRWVLYIDLPTGQISFHTGERGAGPDYPGTFDGRLGASPSRICSWVAQIYAGGNQG